MKLVRPYLDGGPSAVKNFIQLGHRQTDIEYMIAGAGKVHDANLAVFGKDPLTADMECCLRDGSIETLLQGAYIREYHFWEKDCREYFPTMAARNGKNINMASKARQSFVQRIEEILGVFDVDMPPEILSTIKRMRTHVNTMKHKAGAAIDDFITAADYDTAIKALEGFWNQIAACERITG